MSSVAQPLREHSIDLAIDLLEILTADYSQRDFAVRLWNGDLWGNSGDPRFTFVLRHPGALRRMLVGANELTLGEAFIFDDFDVEGDLEAAFAFGDYLVKHELELTEKLRVAGILLRLPHHGHKHDDTPVRPQLHGKQHSKRRDQDAVSYHYDLSNEFYQLWLDRSMMYSCAYFQRGDEDLDTAQVQKLDYLCRKLRLQPGERLLDIGCGWGGLVIHATKHFGAQALGVTLSHEQAELARARIRDAGLQHECDVRVLDYRDLDPREPFDKIVSVGMFEHVGESHLPEYFEHVWNLLRPRGIFLNHGIAKSAVFRRVGPSFIDKYVFPDGCLVPVSTTARIAEACGFEIRDVESLREHYAKTLRIWVRRLESRCEDAVRLTDETVYRIWRLYMSGCAYAFATGRVNLYQVLFSKPDHGATGLPLTRADWCE